MGSPARQPLHDRCRVHISLCTRSGRVAMYWPSACQRPARAGMLSTAQRRGHGTMPTNTAVANGRPARRREVAGPWSTLGNGATSPLLRMASGDHLASLVRTRRLICRILWSIRVTWQTTKREFREKRHTEPHALRAGVINFCLYFPHVPTDLDEIRYTRPALSVAGPLGVS